MPSLPISLQDGFEPVIKIKDQITIGQVIARKPPEQEIPINLSKELEVPIRKVKKYLKKKPGETITAGDIIADKKNFWGKSLMRVVSTTAGKVIRFERETGIVYVFSEDEGGEEEVIVSPIEGTIALCNNGKILVETEKNVLIGTKGIGGEGEDVIALLDEKETVELYHLTADVIEKIVVGGYFPRDSLVKAVSMGTKAVVGTRIEDADLAYLREKQMSVPVLELPTAEMDTLKRWKDKKVYVHGDGRFIILLHGKKSNE